MLAKFKFMKVLVLLLFIVLFTFSSVGTVAARRADTPTPVHKDWTGKFSIAQTVPFIWLRTSPSSTASVISTLYAPTVFIASVNPSGESQIFDGVQWWGFVSLPMTVTFGWVELNSLVRYTEGGPTSTPATPNNLPAHEAWNTSSVVKIKSQVPYVWLRAAPDSHGGALITLPPAVLLSVSYSNAVYDARQWWWQVKHASTGVVGWVEQASLELAPSGVVTENPRPPVQQWAVGAKVRVQLSVSFSWLRGTYNSWSPPVYTVNSGGLVELTAAPLYDGFQWWWPAKIPNTQIAGWVEQKSLELPPAVG
jgi:hypothetical protein